MVGSKFIERVMGMIMKGELVWATVTWKQAHFDAVMSRLFQLPHKGTRGIGVLQRGWPSTAPDPTAPKEFSLDNVQGHVCTTWRVTIPLCGTLNIHGNTDIQGLSMRIHMLAEPSQDPQLPTSVVLTAMYGELYPGSFQVPICLRNLSAHPIMIPPK